MIEKKLHPVLQKTPHLTVSYNVLFDCFDAAAVHGYSTFWDADKDGKEAMVAHVKGRRVLEAIAQYEAHELAKYEAEHNR